MILRIWFYLILIDLYLLDLFCLIWQWVNKLNRFIGVIYVFVYNIIWCQHLRCTFFLCAGAREDCVFFFSFDIGVVERGLPLWKKTFLYFYFIFFIFFLTFHFFTFYFWIFWKCKNNQILKNIEHFEKTFVYIYIFKNIKKIKVKKRRKIKNKHFFLKQILK